MKCVVRKRKAGCPEVFVSNGMTAEELMKLLWDKEKRILESEDELYMEETYCDSCSAVVYTVNDKYTDFVIRTIVEVEK